MIETLDLLLRKGKITNDQAHRMCDRVDGTKAEDEMNKIFIVKGIARNGDREAR